MPAYLCQAEGTELYFVVGLTWLTQSNENSFGVSVNKQELTAKVESLGEQEGTNICECEVPLARISPQENKLVLRVKSGPSPLLVSYFELRTRVRPEVAESHSVLKR